LKRGSGCLLDSGSLSLLWLFQPTLAALTSSPSGSPDRKDNPEAAHECNQIADMRQRYAKDDRPSLYRPDDRRPNHKRCRYDADGCKGDRIVHAVAEGVEPLEVEVDPNAAMARVLDQPAKITGKGSDEPQEVVQRSPAATPRVRRLIALG